MNYKTFGKKLRKIIEDSDEFAVDTIDMKRLVKDAKQAGYGDAIYVAGENEKEVFMVLVLKIE